MPASAPTVPQRCSPSSSTSTPSPASTPTRCSTGALGDPLADVGLLMVYWTEADDAAPMLLTAPTAQEGFLSRKEVLDRYAEQSGRDLSQIDYYAAFGYWKLACIVEGVYARYIGGAMGSTDPKAFEGFKIQVERCADQAAEAMGRLG